MQRSLVRFLFCGIVVMVGLAVALTVNLVFGIHPISALCVSILILAIIFLMGYREFYIRFPARCELILQILDDNGREMTGLEILEQAKGKLSRGIVYNDLQSLVDAGLVSWRVIPQQDHGLPRHYFKIVPEKQD